MLPFRCLDIINTGVHFGTEITHRDTETQSGVGLVKVVNPLRFWPLRVLRRAAS